MLHSGILHVPRRPSAWLVGGLLVLAAAAFSPGPARAQAPRPWTPVAGDSLSAWASEARKLFQAQRVDTVSGPGFRAFELVGRMGRRMIRSIGKRSVHQAAAVEGVLDSMGFDVDVQTDPSQPTFVLLMVRNPHRLSSDAVGFLYWYQAEDLRMQGIVMRGGYRPRMKVWWTGVDTGPYECGILDEERDPEGNLELLLLRMIPSGRGWAIVQYEGDQGEIGRGGEAFWVDIDADERPEIVSWARAAPDSAFEECPSCPQLLTERTFARRESGFELQDSRLFPSPYATFVLFIRLLREGNRAAAQRLLEKPAKLDEAIALGWNAAPRRGDWLLDHAEPDQRWPRWLAMRHRRAEGQPVYVVRFTMKDARWIIQDWGISRGRGGKSVEIGAGGR